jgi:hypothetical protein
MKFYYLGLIFLNFNLENLKLKNLYIILDLGKV